MDRSTARLASRLLSFGLPLLYLLTSISFYLHTYDSAQVKITIVQMVGTVLVGFWCLQLACEREVPFKTYWPVALPLIASLISGTLSWTHAAYRGPSLDEFLRRVFYIHFALIALKEINTLERLRRLVKILLIATAISTIYGLIQFIDASFFVGGPGIDPFVWRLAFSKRVFSTFGNPNFFGNFLVIVTPITLALLLRRNSDKPGSVLFYALSSIIVSGLLWHLDRVLIPLHLESWESMVFTIVLGGFCFWAAMRFSFLGVLFFLITLTNVVTESKGAWIGYTGSFIAFMGLVLLFFAQFRSEHVKRAIQYAALGTLIVCSLTVGVYSRARSDSLRFRICTWVSTWEMAQMHPIWGNGVGSFRVIYPAFRRPQIFHIEAKHNTETDHAENEYWEVLQDEGIIGFGIFIWVIVTFSLLGMRALRRLTESQTIRDPVTGKKRISNDPRAFYMLGILSAFWGMLLHNSMDVSLRFVSSGIFLWLLAGLIGAMVVHDPFFETDDQRNANQPVGPAPGPTERSALTVALGVIASILFLRLTWQILTQFSNVQGPNPEPFGEQLLWTLAWITMLATVGATLWALYRLAQSLKTAVGFVILSLMVYPLNVFWGYFMADAYHNRGIFYSKQQNWETALENYEKVVQLNPNYIMAYYFRGNVFTDRWGGPKASPQSSQADFDNALREYKRVWAIAPNYVQSLHQAGLVYLKKGQGDRARFDAVRAASISHPGDSNLRQQMAAALTETRNTFNQAIYYFKRYHGIDPVFEPNYLRMAYVHTQLAELAGLVGETAEVNRQFDLAEAAYNESLNATVCGIPQNNVLHEDWDRTHRHYNSEVFENLGNARFIRNNFVGAAKAYRMATWKDPNNVRAAKNLAAAYGRLGRNSEAVHVWNEIRRIAPQDPDVMRLFSHATSPAARP